MKCPNGHDNPDSAAFCTQCGVPMKAGTEPAYPQERQAHSSQTSAAQLLQLTLPGDAPLTLIIGYMVFTSLGCTSAAFAYSIGLGFGAAISQQTEELPLARAITMAETRLALLYVASVLLAVACWTATIGLVRCRVWALAWTRSVQVISVLLALLHLLLYFSPSAFLLFLFTAAVAVGIWIYLGTAAVKGYFQ